MKNVLNTDLTGKVAVVTGAGGVLCSQFAAVLARAGAKVALLDINEEAASAVAQAICEEGGTARAYRCDVLSAETCRQVAGQVQSDLGPCDILINGAGGNNPRATTDKEYYFEGDLDAEVKSFFDLDADGVSFVSQPELPGHAPAHAGLCAADAGPPGLQHPEHLLHERLHPLDQDPRLLRRKGRHLELHAVAGRALLQGRHPRQRHRPRVLRHQAEREAALRRRRQPHAPHGQDPRRDAMGRFGKAEELSGAVLFLLNNEAASFITGVVLPIDGGFSAYSGV